MKADEVKPCAMCGRGVMHTGLPLFYRVKVEAMGVDVRAVQRRAGLEQMMGGGSAGALLARVMGPDEDIAKPVVDDYPTVLICQPCAFQPHPLLLFMERAAA